MSKVILVNVGENGKEGQIDEWLGLESPGMLNISAYLNENGVETEVLNQPIEGLSNKEIIKRIIESRADFVGLNQYFYTRKETKEIASKLKMRNPKIQILLGGYDASFTSLDESYLINVDYIIRGPGEKAVLKIIRGQTINLKGVAQRHNRKVHDKLKERAETLSLDKFPIQIRQNIGALVAVNSPASINSSFGCDFRCKFCLTPPMYPKGRVEKPENKVIQEIDLLVDNKINKLCFYDEDFIGITPKSINRANRILKHAEEKGAKSWAFMSAPGVLRSKELGLLNNWNKSLYRIYIGIEGGCKESLLELGNHSCLNPVVNSAAIRAVREAGIALQIGYIMFNPYSTFETLRASGNFLYKNDEASTIVNYLHKLRPYEGTELCAQLQKEGLLHQAELRGSGIGLRQGIPYDFKVDIQKSETRMKDCAKALCEIPNELTTKSDNLNMTIYTALTIMGHDIFSETETDSLVKNYKKNRKYLSRLNHDFFMDSLSLFEQRKRKKFEIKKTEYLNNIYENNVILENLKNTIYEKMKKTDSGIYIPKP